MAPIFIRLYSEKYSDYLSLCYKILEAIRNLQPSHWRLIPHKPTDNIEEVPYLLNFNHPKYPNFGSLCFYPKNEWIDIQCRNSAFPYTLPDPYKIFIFNEFISFLHQKKIINPIYVSSLNFQPPFLLFPIYKKIYISLELHSHVTASDITHDIMQSLSYRYDHDSLEEPPYFFNFSLYGSTLICSHHDFSSRAQVEIMSLSERILFIISPLIHKGKKTSKKILSFIALHFSRYISLKFSQYLLGHQSFNL